VNRFALKIAIGVGLFASLPNPSYAADPVADFYAGKTLRIIVGLAPGGTYDLYARTIARYVGKYIPGSPRTIVQNMPGAASYVAASNVFSVAPQDGTVVGAIAAAMPYQHLVDPNAPKLDIPRINWLPSVSAFTVVMVVKSELPINNVDDLRTHPVVMATLSPGQLPSLIVAATNETLGSKIKAINGHPGMNDAMIALERGELDGYPAIPVDALKRVFAGMMSQGKLRVLLQYGPAPSPDYPNAAYAVNLAKNADDRMLLDLAQAPLKIGYAYMMGPDVPKERVRALSEAFLATFKDPEFLADAERQILNVDPVDADTVRKLVTDANATPPAVVERMRDLYRHLFQ
jgi:tripartite-type tricarboxylate transporter receptor subunit TctC